MNEEDLQRRIYNEVEWLQKRVAPDDVYVMAYNLLCCIALIEQDSKDPLLKHLKQSASFLYTTMKAQA